MVSLSAKDIPDDEICLVGFEEFILSIIGGSFFGVKLFIPASLSFSLFRNSRLISKTDDLFGEGWNFLGELNNGELPTESRLDEAEIFGEPDSPFAANQNISILLSRYNTDQNLV